MNGAPFNTAGALRHAGFVVVSRSSLNKKPRRRPVAPEKPTEPLRDAVARAMDLEADLALAEGRHARAERLSHRAAEIRVGGKA